MRGFRNVDLCSGTGQAPAQVITEGHCSILGVGTCPMCGRAISFNSEGEMRRHKPTAQSYDEPREQWARESAHERA